MYIYVDEQNAILSFGLCHKKHNEQSTSNKTLNPKNH